MIVYRKLVGNLKKLHVRHAPLDLVNMILELGRWHKRLHYVGSTVFDSVTYTGA